MVVAAAFALSATAFLPTANAAESVVLPEPTLVYPLDGGFSPSSGQSTAATATGPYRFLKIHGRIGYHPTGLRSFLHIPTDLRTRNAGAIILSVCPLETLGVASVRPSFITKDPQAQSYRLLADAAHDEATVAPVSTWNWRAVWHPTMLAQYGERKAGFGLAPCVMVEHLPLQKDIWYQLAYTWDLSEHRLRIYVNGFLCGAADYPFTAPPGRPGLILGNSAMAFAGLQFHGQELSAAQVAAVFARTNSAPDKAVMDELQALFTVRPRGERRLVARRRLDPRPADRLHQPRRSRRLAAARLHDRGIQNEGDGNHAGGSIDGDARCDPQGDPDVSLEPGELRGRHRRAARLPAGKGLRLGPAGRGRVRHAAGGFHHRPPAPDHRRHGYDHRRPRPQLPESARMLALGGADFICLPIMGDLRADRMTPGPPIFNEDRWKAILRTRALDNQVNLVVARNGGQGSCIIDRRGDIIAWNEGDRNIIEATIQPETIRYWAGGDLSEVTYLLRRPSLYDPYTDEAGLGPLPSPSALPTTNRP